MALEPRIDNYINQFNVFNNRYFTIKKERMQFITLDTESWKFIPGCKVCMVTPELSSSCQNKFIS